MLTANQTEQEPFTSQPAFETDQSRIYDGVFWLAYVANFFLMIGISLMFRFADYVVFLGGTAGTAGLIVGIGMGGSLALRGLLGQSIDRYGTSHLWLASACLFVVSCLAFVPLQTVSVWIYGARLLFNVSLAGIFTCWMVYMTTRTPAPRRAELLGVLGTSGMLGMLVGPQIGDYLFDHLGTGRESFAVMFLVAAGFGVAYTVIAWRFMRRAPDPQPHASPPPYTQLVVRYWPGALLAVAFATGVGVTFPQTFLTRFTARQGLSGIGLFFVVYCGTTLAIRVLGRRWPERFGRRRALIFGLISLSTSLLLYLTVTRDWQLLMPALFGGAAHAVLFPCVVSLGTESFPDRHRGAAVTLVLGALDLGQVLGAPVLGWTIDRWGFHAMFLSTAALTACTAFFYAQSHALKSAGVAPAETLEPAARELAVVTASAVATASPRSSGR